jgi:pimeloyl-ACP methyl ester carboxylesterase
MTAACESGRFLTPDGVPLAWTRRGSGRERAILVVPGILMHREAPEHRLLAERLAGTADVVTLDVRGHGDSAGVFSWGRREHEDVAAFARSLRGDYRRLGGLGFSFGGFHVCVAAALARCFDAVASVGAPADLRVLDHNPLGRRLLRTLPWIVRRRRRLARLGLPGLRRPSPERLVGAIAPVPLLVVHGTDDWLVSARHARRLHDAAREPRGLHFVEGGLHAEAMLADDPEALVAPLEAFFAERL